MNKTEMPGFLRFGKKMFNVSLVTQAHIEGEDQSRLKLTVVLTKGGYEFKGAEAQEVWDALCGLCENASGAQPDDVNTSTVKPHPAGESGQGQMSRW